MSDPFVGEIRMFAGTFAPRGNAFCDGQLLAVSQNDALFSLLGTIYGGDGRTTFGLPDLRGRIPLHQGQGPGLTNRPIGHKSGVENVTLTAHTLAAHTHEPMQASTDPATLPNPNNAVLATGNVIEMFSGDPQDVSLNANATTTAGGSNHHNNMAPFIGINYIIALYGIYPSRQ